MNQTRQKIFLSLCLLAALPATAGLFDKAPPKPIVLEAQADRADVLKQLIDNDSFLGNVAKLPINGQKNVALGNVRVHILTKSNGGDVQNEVMGRGSASVSVDYKLLGIQPEAVQTVADTFYADLAKALTSQGYAVLPAEKLMENAEFQQLVASTQSPVVESGMISASAKQTALATGLMRNTKYIDLSRALGNIPVLDVDVSVDFAEFQSEGSKGMFNLSAKVSHNTKLSIREGSLNVFAGPDPVFIMMPFKRKIKLQGDIAASVEDKGASAADMALTVLSVLGKNSYSGKNYEVNPVKNYPEVMSKSLQPFAEVLSNVLKKQ